MNITLPDGKSITLDEIKADVEAAQKKFVSTEFCFTWPTMLGLLNKLDELNPEKKFTVFWLTGTAQLLEGATLDQAFANAGIGGGATSTIDFWGNGDIRNEYEWIERTRTWARKQKTF